MPHVLHCLQRSAHVGVTAKIVGYEGIPESRTYVPIPPVS